MRQNYIFIPEMTDYGSQHGQQPTGTVILTCNRPASTLCETRSFLVIKLLHVRPSVPEAVAPLVMKYVGLTGILDTPDRIQVDATAQSYLSGFFHSSSSYM